MSLGQGARFLGAYVGFGTRHYHRGGRALKEFTSKCAPYYQDYTQKKLDAALKLGRAQAACARDRSPEGGDPGIAEGGDGGSVYESPFRPEGAGRPAPR